MELFEFEELILEELYEVEIFNEYLEKNLIEIEKTLQDRVISDVKIDFLEVSVLEYLEEISKIKEMTKEEIEHAINDLNIETKDELITKNLKIAVIFAMYLLKEGIDYLDLVQEGSIGIIEGIEKFKESGYLKLDEYLKLYVIRKMVIYIDKKLKQNKAEFIGYFQGLKIEYQDNEELKEELNRKIDTIEKIEYRKLKNILSDLEIEIVIDYYGFGIQGKKSMYEIEKKYNLNNGQGEEIFQKGINKLSKFGGEFFEI